MSFVLDSRVLARNAFTLTARRSTLNAIIEAGACARSCITSATTITEPPLSRRRRLMKSIDVEQAATLAQQCHASDDVQESFPWECLQQISPHLPPGRRNGSSWNPC